MTGASIPSLVRLIAWLIYLVGAAWLVSAIIFATLLTWDEFAFRRRQRRQRRDQA
jgi:Flp pilus assembly protein TadB